MQKVNTNGSRPKEELAQTRPIAEAGSQEKGGRRQPRAPGRKWVRFPVAALLDGRLRLSDLRLLGLILAYSDRRSRTTFASSTTLARAAGISPRQAKDSLRRLAELGYLATYRSPDRQTPQRGIRTEVYQGVKQSSPVKHTSPPRCTPVHHPGEAEFTTPVKQSSPISRCPIQR